MCTVFPTNKTIHAQSTPNEITHSTRNLSKRHQPPTCNPPKRNRRGGACVPARTFAQRRFHTNQYTHCARGFNDGCALGRATRAGTQAPPLPNSTKPCGASLPHRGYTFDSAGLASATQPTLGNDVSKEATPLGVVLYLIAHHYHTRRMISPYEN